MHPLRFVAALPAGALALTLAAAPAVAGPGHDHHGHGGGWHHGGHEGHGSHRAPGGHGRTASPAAARQPGTVSVTGHGESTVAPDMAVITLGVTVQAPSAAEAMRQNTQRQQVVIDTLRARGIEGRDIQTSGLNLTPVQDFSREGQPPVVTGYQATNMVTVRVRDLPRLGEALDALVGAGANEIHGIGFQRENIAAAEGDARARAVENARLRAEIMANAAGMTLGRLVSITDALESRGPQPMMRQMAMDAAASAPVPIEAGELAIAAEVTMTWELRPAPGGAGPMDGHHGGIGGHGHGMMQHGAEPGTGQPHGQHGGSGMGGMGMGGMPMQGATGADGSGMGPGMGGMGRGGATMPTGTAPAPRAAAGTDVGTEPAPGATSPSRSSDAAAAPAPGGPEAAAAGGTRPATPPTPGGAAADAPDATVPPAEDAAPAPAETTAPAPAQSD